MNNDHDNGLPGGSQDTASQQHHHAGAQTRTDGSNELVKEPQFQQRPGPDPSGSIAATLKTPMQGRRGTQSAPAVNTMPQVHQHDHYRRRDDNEKHSPPVRSPTTAAREESPQNQRISFQLPIPAHTRKSHDSEEFDRRYDGPFGRPSISMTRRQSLVQLDQPSPIAAPTELSTVETAERRMRMPTSASIATTAAEEATFQPEPPKLNYTLRTRKFAIIFFWTVILFDSVVMPIGLYFGLWYGVGPGNPDNKKLSANTVFSIVTAALGGASIMEYFMRFWRLYKKGSTCRVIGAHRWYLDWFHWMFTLAWIIVMIELIIGSVQEDPYIRLLSMPVTTMLFVFGTLLITIDLCRYFQIPAPVRISSIPKGSQLRPGIYSLIEDVCAVDGSGGTGFRVAFDKRYEASHIFRAMLRRLGIMWAVGAESCAVLCTILIFSLDSADAAYTIGWSVPFIWAGIWTAFTFWYAKRELRKEKELWAAEAGKFRIQGIM